MTCTEVGLGDGVPVPEEQLDARPGGSGVPKNQVESQRIKAQTLPGVVSENRA